MFQYKKGQRVNLILQGSHFFLRGSVEYTNPQLTVEELQGIIGSRFLAECGNYFNAYGLSKPDRADTDQICEALKKPSQGCIIPFLLNTDDVEADRYSMNPLKRSIVASGQSAFPVAYITTENLRVDSDFQAKYGGSLISENEVDLINRYLKSSRGSYIDFIDTVKYAQMERFSEVFGIDLSLPAMHMPLAILKAETKQSLLHHIISETHRDYKTIEQAYNCMGRSMIKRKTLLTIPHSKKGFGSKRAVRGKIHFRENKLDEVKIKYQTTRLYPNEIDPNDVSIAYCNDSFTISGKELANYSFKKTSSSPQFFLYSLGSPENATLWHGIGAFASPKLVQSYVAVRNAARKGRLIDDLTERYDVNLDVPIQFNLVPKGMWVHPIHKNIDSSVGCIEDFSDLTRMGMDIEHFPIPS